jgi:hypothetical protein
MGGGVVGGGGSKSSSSTLVAQSGQEVEGSEVMLMVCAERRRGREKGVSAMTRRPFYRGRGAWRGGRVAAVGIIKLLMKVISR